MSTAPMVDGISLPIRVRIDPDAFDLAANYARTHRIAVSEAVNELVRKYANTVDAGSAPGSPVAGRGDSGDPSSPLSPVLTLEESSLPAVVDVSEIIVQPIPHVHLDLHGYPCVYGDRCGQ